MRISNRFTLILIGCLLCLPLSAPVAHAAPEAIAVPWEPSDPLRPHYSYSGATTRLKAIARGDATEYRWDFGDGSDTPWITISNAYDLGVEHVYTGIVSQQFVATVYVRNGGGDQSQDTYRTELFESSNLGDPGHIDVRVNMAIDEGLWWLHRTMNRATYGPGSPGYDQPYGWWSDNIGGYPLPATCTSVDAFQLHGSKANGDFDEDPYVETVQRALNYMLWHTWDYPISVQPHGDPDVLDNGIGLVINYTDSLFNTRQTYIGGICMTALASSGVPNRVAAVGHDYVLGRDYADIVQDMVDFFAYGQVDFGSGRGGWRYYANYSNSDMSTAQWPPLAMIAAEENMGSQVPQFVRDELPFFLNQTYHASCDNNHGGHGYSNPSDHVNCTKAAAGIICREFLGTPLEDSSLQGSMGFLYRHWNDTGGSWIYQKVLGNSYVMYGIMKAMRNPDPDVSRIHNYQCGPGQMEDSFDWYYKPTGQAHMGLANYVVGDQHADGSWDDSTGPNPVYDAFATGWRVLILLEGVTIQPPQAVVCDCDEQEYNLDQDIHLDGSCSFHPDQNRSIVSYEWDFEYDGTFQADDTGVAATIPGGYSATGLYSMALRVVDDRPDNPQSDTVVCEVDVHEPPHCPHAFAGGPYAGFNGVPITLDGSSSWDPDNEIVSYEWDVDGDSLFGAEDNDVFGELSDAVGITAEWTWDDPYVGSIGLRVTDAEGEFVSCSDIDYDAVDIGNHPPVADPNGPYTACEGCTITLDGSGSYDIDPGDAIGYVWDLNNDGQYDECSEMSCEFEAGPDAGVQYDVCLKVTDSHGESDIECTTVLVVENQPPELSCISPTLSTDPEVCEAEVDCEAIAFCVDPDGDELTLVCVPTWPYGLGSTSVFVTCSDGQVSLEADCAVTVEDNEPPEIECPADLTLECPADTEPESTGFAMATDNCAMGSIGHSDAIDPGCGETLSITRTWSATDAAANTAECIQTIEVVDTQLPSVMCGAATSTLWPPNHKMEDVGFSYSFADACDAGPLAIGLWVSSDEHPATAEGAGGETHCPDAEIQADQTVLLRAERSGAGDGRVYVINVSVTDACDNVGYCQAVVGVPHDKKQVAVDSGQFYDATDCAGKAVKLVDESDSGMNGRSSLEEGSVASPSAGALNLPPSRPERAAPRAIERKQVRKPANREETGVRKPADRKADRRERSGRGGDS